MTQGCHLTEHVVHIGGKDKGVRSPSAEKEKLRNCVAQLQECKDNQCCYFVKKKVKIRYKPYAKFKVVEETPFQQILISVMLGTCKSDIQLT